MQIHDQALVDKDYLTATLTQFRLDLHRDRQPAGHESVVRLIWATRGRSRDFRFLLDGGYSGPLPAYERAFVGMQGQVEGCRRTEDGVALRFLDPGGRKDA